MLSSDSQTRVSDRIDRLRTYWSSLASDRSLVEESTDFREGDQASYLKRNPAENAGHFADKLKVTVDLVNHVLGSVATTYSTPARRYVEPDDSGEASAWYQEHLWDFGEYSLDSTFQDADKDVLFGGIVAIEPRYVLEPDGSDGVEAIYYRRHEFEVLPRSDDPRKAEAVVFPVMTETRMIDGKPVDVSIRHYWDSEVFARLVDWTVEDEEEDIFEHGIGEVPIVFVKRLRSQASFYCSGAHTNLVRQCQNINKLFTEFAHAVKLQHGYPWSKGPIKNAILAPDGVLELASDGAFGVATPGANLAGMEAGIQRIADNLAVTLGMAPGGLSLSPNSTQSGIAIIAQQGEQERVRQERVSTWARAEKRYHAFAIKIYEAFGGQTAIPEGVVRVVHQRPKTQISLAERERHVEWLRKHSLISRKGMLQLVEPDMSEEQIENQIAEADADTGLGATIRAAQSRRFASAQQGTTV